MVTSQMSSSRSSICLSCAYVVASLICAQSPADHPACLEQLTLYHEEPRVNNEYPLLLDANGDGRVDMITIDDPRMLRVYLDDGAKLVLADSFQIMPYGWFAGTGDFDNDGHPDLLINATYGWNCGSNMVRVYWNSGNPAHPFTGSYTQIGLMSVPFCIGSDPIDFDGDGLLDIITTSMPFSSNDTSRRTRTTRNLGGRSFGLQAEFVWPRDLYGRSTADINGDGRADFLATVKSGWADGQWGSYLYLGKGDGTFEPAIISFSAPRTTHGFPIDFDGAASPGSGFGVYVGTDFSQTLTLARWSASGAGLETQTTNIPSPFRVMHAVDATLDGLDDLVLMGTTFDGRLGLIPNDGEGSFGSAVVPMLLEPGFDFVRLVVQDGDTVSLNAVAINSSKIRVYRASCNLPFVDCDNDGISDAEEIAAGAPDDNDNGIPDECEVGRVVMVPADFPSIQSAIDASVNGWVIRVAPGIYAERIALGNRQIVVEAANGAAATIIDGSGIPGSVVTMIAPEGNALPGPILRGFTIRGGTIGTQLPPTTNFVGGGLYAAFSRGMVQDCRFESNSAPFGGGAYLYRCHMTLDGCTFEANDAGSIGGGVLVFRGASTLEDCQIIDNFAVAQSGGVHVVGGDSSLVRTAIRGNESLTVGGGLGVYPEVGVPDGEDGTATIVSDCVIEENSCKEAGGGLWVRSGFDTVYLDGTTICDNVPDEVSGAFVDLGKNTLCICLADLNDDGIVNGADISVLLGFWGLTGKGVTGDIVPDGTVNGADLAALLSSWGECQ